MCHLIISPVTLQKFTDKLTYFFVSRQVGVDNQANVERQSTKLQFRIYWIYVLENDIANHKSSYYVLTAAHINHINPGYNATRRQDYAFPPIALENNEDIPCLYITSLSVGPFMSEPKDAVLAVTWYEILT